MRAFHSPGTTIRAAVLAASLATTGAASALAEEPDQGAAVVTPLGGRVLGLDLLDGRAGRLPGRHHGRHGPARRDGPPRRRPLLDRPPAGPGADHLPAPAARLRVPRARGPPARRPRRGARGRARGPGRLSGGGHRAGFAGSAREPSPEIIAMNLSKRIGVKAERDRFFRRLRDGGGPKGCRWAHEGNTSAALTPE